MNDDSPVLVPYMAKAYDYRSFCCGEPQLDEWLTRIAGQSEKRNETRTHLLVNGTAESREIYGYFALQNSQIRPDEASHIRRKNWKYPLPATLLAQLAVSSDRQGKGFGGLLLTHAMRISVAASQLSGSAALLVDCLNEEAKSFYAKYGLRAFPKEPTRLFITMSDMTGALDKEGNS
ncbi:MAG: GNAT family N-acetyltransferase [Ancrocorticia sp.]|uniref:GNAT family N-acetyltransferase n=1 Tax=Ancrocorticia sp. TaxID=2593684 RepID=UPI003F9106E6